MAKSAKPVPWGAGCRRRAGGAKARYFGKKCRTLKKRADLLANRALASRFLSKGVPKSVLMIRPESRRNWGAPVIRTLSALTAATLAVAPVAEAYAASCYSPAETTAVHVRMLQSELMVAALACRDSNPELGMVAQYNDFVRRLSDRLVSHSKVLQAHFQKAFGSDGMRRLEAFVTALANDASKRSMTSASYCQSASVLFHDVSMLERPDLERFSTTHAAEVAMPLPTCASGEHRQAASE